MGERQDFSPRFQLLWTAFEHYYYAEHLLNEAFAAVEDRLPAHELWSYPRALGSMAAEYLTFAVEATQEREVSR